MFFSRPLGRKIRLRTAVSVAILLVFLELSGILPLLQPVYAQRSIEVRADTALIGAPDFAPLNSSMKSLGLSNFAEVSSYTRVTKAYHADFWADAGWALQSNNLVPPTPGSGDQRTWQVMFSTGLGPDAVESLHVSRTKDINLYTVVSAHGGICFWSPGVKQFFPCGRVWVTHTLTYRNSNLTFQVEMFHSVVSSNPLPYTIDPRDELYLRGAVNQSIQQYDSMVVSEARTMLNKVLPSFSQLLSSMGAGCHGPELKGDVKLMRANQDETIALPGQVLNVGDQLFAGYVSSVCLWLPHQGQVMQVESNTEVEVASSTCKFCVSLGMGEVRPQIHVTGPARPWLDIRFETPTATASVRGTDFVLRVNKDNSTDVFVNEGIVSFVNNMTQKEINITAGMKGSVNGTNTIGPLPMSSSDLNMFSASSQIPTLGFSDAAFSSSQSGPSSQTTQVSLPFAIPASITGPLQPVLTPISNLLGVSQDLSFLILLAVVIVLVAVAVKVARRGKGKQ